MAGGHWPDTATKAALKIFHSSQSTQSTANELLSDIQEVFEMKRISKISTADLIQALLVDEEKGWATYNRGKALSPRQLTGKLRDYCIYSKTVRLGYETAKGYEIEQFTDVFARYLTQHTPFFSSQCNISLKLNADNTLSVTNDVTDDHAKSNIVTNVTNCDETQKQKVTLKPLPVLDCDDVADKAPLIQKCVRI